MSGHYQPASETPLKWRFAGGSIMARLWWYLDPSYSHQLKNKNKIKTLSNFDPLWQNFLDPCMSAQLFSGATSLTFGLRLCLRHFSMCLSRECWSALQMLTYAISTNISCAGPYVILLRLFTISAFFRLLSRFILQKENLTWVLTFYWIY